MLLPLAISLLLGAFTPSPAPDAASPAPVQSTKGEPAPLPSWYSRVNTGAPGGFAPIRSFDATYSLNWGKMQAAHVEVQCVSSPASHEIRSTFKATTTGAARALYKLDASHVSVVDRAALRPLWFEQTELNSRRHTFARLDFSPAEAVRTVRDLDKNAQDATAVGKPRKFSYPGLYDMQSLLLYLRSLPLAAGDEKTVPFMTAGSPYVATVKVVGRSQVRVKAGEYPAIECSLTLEKVKKDGTLEPRKGFKSARAWISDDANRLLIKAESEVFIGTVSLELAQVIYPDAAAR